MTDDSWKKSLTWTHAQHTFDATPVFFPYLFYNVSIPLCEDKQIESLLQPEDGVKRIYLFYHSTIGFWYKWI